MTWSGFAADDDGSVAAGEDDNGDDEGDDLEGTCDEAGDDYDLVMVVLLVMLMMLMMVVMLTCMWI